MCPPLPDRGHGTLGRCSAPSRLRPAMVGTSLIVRARCLAVCRLRSNTWTARSAAPSRGPIPWNRGSRNWNPRLDMVGTGSIIRGRCTAGWDRGTAIRNRCPRPQHPGPTISKPCPAIQRLHTEIHCTKYLVPVGQYASALSADRRPPDHLVRTFQVDFQVVRARRCDYPPRHGK